MNKKYKTRRKYIDKNGNERIYEYEYDTEHWKRPHRNNEIVKFPEHNKKKAWIHPFPMNFRAKFLRQVFWLMLHPEKRPSH